MGVASEPAVCSWSGVLFHCPCVVAIVGENSRDWIVSLYGSFQEDLSFSCGTMRSPILARRTVVLNLGRSFRSVSVTLLAGLAHFPLDVATVVSCKREGISLKCEEELDGFSVVVEGVSYTW